MTKNIPGEIRWQLYEIEKSKIPKGLSQKEFDDRIKEITKRLRV